MRIWLVGLLLLIGSVVMAPLAHARQSEPLIADLVEYAEVRRAVPASTLETFRRVVRPSAEQQTAAELLVSAARTEVSRVVNRHLRTVRDDPTLEQIQESERAVVRDVAVIERQLMADLKLILDPPQSALFPAFERAHRRSLLRQVQSLPLPVDLWQFLEKNNFDPKSLEVSKRESLAALLERFDRESDAALVRERRALKAYFEIVRLGFDGSEESTQRDRKAQRELYASREELGRVQAAVVEPLLDLLPGAVAEKLIVESIGVATEGFGRALAEPERYPVVREVLALGLTAEQRGKVRELVDLAKKEALAMARTALVDQARFVMESSDGRAKYATAPLNVFLGSASKLRVRVSGEVLALLTSEQRAEYDASDVIEPSSTSTVLDE